MIVEKIYKCKKAITGTKINKGTVKCTLDKLSKKSFLNILTDSCELDIYFFFIMPQGLKRSQFLCLLME